MARSDAPFHRLRMPPAGPPRAGLAAHVGLLAPRIEAMADDVWELARKSPGLAADPALVADAARLLRRVHRLLQGEPGRQLLPARLAPGLRLHALGIGLRQMQLAVAQCLARRAAIAVPPRSLDDEIGDINRMTAIYLRDLMTGLIDRRQIELPPDLRIPAPPPPPGAPPAPKPHIRRTRVRRRNAGRRAARGDNAGSRPPPG